MEYKGHPVYTMDGCIFCKACERACKQKAIAIEVEIMPDGRRMPKSYRLDYSKCNFCGECAKKCPYDVIEMIEDREKMESIVGDKVYDASMFVELKKQLGLDRNRRSGFSKPENCIACQLCVLSCPVGAISCSRNGDAEISIDPDKCGACGVCVRNCPAMALDLVDLNGTFSVKVELPEKIIDAKYFGNLKKKVIDSGLCSHCSTCTAICPVYGITAGDKPIDFPNWENDCIDCGACIRVCPRWEYEPLSGVGDYIEILAGRSKRFTGQDGAMVTEIMASALEMGIIDASLFVDRDEEWRTKIVTIRKPKQLEKSTATGTKYSFADVMPELRKAVFRSKKGVGFVGTPCMVSGLRKIQNIESFRDRVGVAVALFCTENFYHNQLKEFLARKGIDLSKAVKTDITKGKFIVKFEDGEVSFPVKELEEIIPSGCRMCIDFTGVESDISVGSVGSDAGFSTIIVRTERGREIIEYIKEKGYAEFREADLSVVEKLANYKIKKNKKNLERL
ncbi:Coenzyme F420-reducing hydrogenase, beta subunit [Archaeoglobus sulfaticallidus PM70-1]|uniref:Coenzyme F420-reducing hydrogenase, beta subunit n=1 Tax=Archaeoglobus sulfaticallidus PM70-1 TaxID=387631 RepID=N0BKY2_9EURY|nr:Coenzyme F420 hydrogenase/dehydrogenase, beta subunit C-terminal domain [Archaeoglobus sulfaticallidus]AGK60870.1 Coenzyme F420-reducing hydrogenase, beta subunit [Archaeoglobus sulfaticallidus PM70-1]